MCIRWGENVDGAVAPAGVYGELTISSLHMILQSGGARDDRELKFFHSPPLPPTTEDDRFDRLRLLRSRRVGVVTYHRLMREHGSAQNALAALPEVARNAGIDGYEVCPPGVIVAELKAAKAAKARLLCFGDPEYPALLAETDEAPPILWAKGDLSLLPVRPSRLWARGTPPPSAPAWQRRWPAIWARRGTSSSRAWRAASMPPRMTRRSRLEPSPSPLVASTWFTLPRMPT